MHPPNISIYMVWFQQVKHCGSTWFKQTQCRLRIYPGLKLRAQPGLSSLPGSPLCLQLVLVLLDVIVLHSITTATWKAHMNHTQPLPSAGACTPWYHCPAQHHHSYFGKHTRITRNHTQSCTLSDISSTDINRAATAAPV